jgi:hypothetical protein
MNVTCLSPRYATAMRDRSPCLVRFSARARVYKSTAFAVDGWIPFVSKASWKYAVVSSSRVLSPGPCSHARTLSTAMAATIGSGSRAACSTASSLLRIWTSSCFNSWDTRLRARHSLFVKNFMGLGLKAPSKISSVLNSPDWFSIRPMNVFFDTLDSAKKFHSISRKSRLPRTSAT